MSALSFQFFICISSQFSPSPQKYQLYSPCVLQKNSCTKSHQRKTCIFVITVYEREGKGTCLTLHKRNTQDRNHPGAISYPQTPPCYTMVLFPPQNSICLGSIACLSLQLHSLLIYKTILFRFILAFAPKMQIQIQIQAQQNTVKDGWQGLLREENGMMLTCMSQPSRPFFPLAQCMSQGKFQTINYSYAYNTQCLWDGPRNNDNLHCQLDCICDHLDNISLGMSERTFLER